LFPGRRNLPADVRQSLEICRKSPLSNLLKADKASKLDRLMVVIPSDIDPKISMLTSGPDKPSAGWGNKSGTAKITDLCLLTEMRSVFFTSIAKEGIINAKKWF